MVARRAGTPGTRNFGGRYFILNGRGTKAEMVVLADQLRKRWRYVRMVPYHPFLRKDMQALVDDYCCYVFERRV